MCITEHNPYTHARDKQNVFNLHNVNIFLFCFFSYSDSLHNPHPDKHQLPVSLLSLPPASVVIPLNSSFSDVRPIAALPGPCVIGRYGILTARAGNERQREPLCGRGEVKALSADSLLRTVCACWRMSMFVGQVCSTLQTCHSSHRISYVWGCSTRRHLF